MQHFVFNSSSTLVINWLHSNASLLANQTVKSIAAHLVETLCPLRNATIQHLVLNLSITAMWLSISLFCLGGGIYNLSAIIDCILCMMFHFSPSDNRQKINDNYRHKVSLHPFFK